MLLVIDDDAAIRSAMIRLLTVLGYEASACALGQDALDQMQACTPQLVILDYMMPGMSGLEVLQAMRSSPALRDVPVILFSAIDGPVQEEALRAGANACMVKPVFDVERLRAEIRRWIDPASASPA